MRIHASNNCEGIVDYRRNGESGTYVCRKCGLHSMTPGFLSITIEEVEMPHESWDLRFNAFLAKQQHRFPPKLTPAVLAFLKMVWLDGMAFGIAEGEVANEKDITREAMGSKS